MLSARLGGRRQRISTDSAGTGRVVASLLVEAQIYSAACQLRSPLFRKWVRSALLLLKCGPTAPQTVTLSPPAPPRKERERYLLGNNVHDGGVQGQGAKLRRDVEFN